MRTRTVKSVDVVIGTNRSSIGTVGEVFVCLLSDAYDKIPLDAQYVSMRIKGMTLTVSSANDILTWVCKIMSVNRVLQLQPLLRRRQLSWFKGNSHGMNRPYRIAYNCYVDLDGSGATPLLRAAKILEWLSWPKKDVTITYKLSNNSIPSSSPQEVTIKTQTVHEPTTSQKQVIPHPSVKPLHNGAGCQVTTFSLKYDRVNTLVNSEPISLSFKHKVYNLNRKWFLLPAQISIALEAFKPGALRRLVAERQVPNMGIKCSGMKRELWVEEASIWYEANGTIRDFIRQARTLCKLFAVDMNDVSITYVTIKNENETDDPKQPVIINEDNPRADGPVVPVATVVPTTELKDVPSDVFVRSAVLEILKQGRDDGEIWEGFQSRPWCFRELGLRNSLLRKLKMWERPQEFSGEYSVLDADADYMILGDLGGFKRDAFLAWVQNIGLAIEHLCSVLHVKLPAWASQETKNADTNESRSDKSILKQPAGYVDKMNMLLKENFKAGVRIGSVIDKNKIKRAWVERFGDPEEEMDWDALIIQSGMQYDGKVFPQVDSTALMQFLESRSDGAHGIFCYDTLFEKESETFVSLGVQSGVMLRYVIEAIHLHGGFSELGIDVGMDKIGSPCWSELRNHKCFAINGGIRSVRLTDVLVDAFAEKERWTRDELEARFPYVPADMIRQKLMQDKRFASTGDCTYALAASIQLDRDECNRNARAVMAHVAEDGFYSLKQCAFPRSLELNGDVAPSAVYAAFFRDYLALNYDKHGVIICRKGEQVGSLEIVRAFCRSRDEVTPDEVLSVAHELGVTGTSRFLEVAHEEMVRVEDGKFVLPKLVSFDISGCDAALDELMPTCGVMPLCGVRSFAAFPAVPIFSWNVFLLESYLRRESHRYQYMQNFRTTRPQSAVGAIVRRGIGIESFEDALARAVVAAKIQTTEEAVGDFLLHEQYIRRRREIEKTVAELARKMAAREEEYD